MDTEDWVQCDKCDKWRRYPKYIAVSSSWHCKQNTWDERNDCSVPEEDYTDNAATIISPSDSPPQALKKQRKKKEKSASMDTDRDIDILTESSKEGSMDSSLESPRAQMFKCTECSKEFLTPQSLSGHNPNCPIRRLKADAARNKNAKSSAKKDSTKREFEVKKEIKKDTKKKKSPSPKTVKPAGSFSTSPQKLRPMFEAPTCSKFNVLVFVCTKFGEELDGTVCV